MNAQEIGRRLYLDTAYFHDDSTLMDSLVSYGSDLPSGFKLCAPINRDRFVLIGCNSASLQRYVVGRYTRHMEFRPLYITRHELSAQGVLHDWLSLSPKEIEMALFLAEREEGKPQEYIPRDVQTWGRLPEHERQLVWSLISSGAPGNLDTILTAAQVCGLIGSASSIVSHEGTRQVQPE